MRSVITTLLATFALTAASGASACDLKNCAHSKTKGATCALCAKHGKSCKKGSGCKTCKKCDGEAQKAETSSGT
jgi:hypothetical protein